MARIRRRRVYAMTDEAVERCRQDVWKRQEAKLKLRVTKWKCKGELESGLAKDEAIVKIVHTVSITRDPFFEDLEFLRSIYVNGASATVNARDARDAKW